eukprot:47085-Eustigmatos_ZCMA.PRE.1
MELWESFKEKVEQYEAEQVMPPLDGELDNLERQGFTTNSDYSCTWMSTQGDSIRSKATFDLQPTNPHVDIMRTGQCEVWVRKVELVKKSNTYAPVIRNVHISQHNAATFPHVNVVKAACIYNPEGKCVGMMTPERLHLLEQCFQYAQSSGLHIEMVPPVHSFASELVGLLMENNRCLNPKGSTVSKTTRESQARILPDHVYTALRRWAGVTKEKKM